MAKRWIFRYIKNPMKTSIVAETKEGLKFYSKDSDKWYETSWEILDHLQKINVIECIAEQEKCNKCNGEAFFIGLCENHFKEYSEILKEKGPNFIY